MYKVGDTLFFVPNYDRQPREVKITKVGRKWLHCRIYGQMIRVDVATLRPHENDTSGKFYNSLAEYEQKEALGNAWPAFQRLVARGYYAPDGVTVEKIQAATALLFGGEL